MPNSMNKIKTGLRSLTDSIVHHRLAVAIILLAASVLASLLLRNITTIPGGLSKTELAIAMVPIGWNGILQDPFFLFSKLIRSAGYLFFGEGGALTSRMPSIIMGVIAIASFTLIIKLWHGTRIAVFGFILFATSAWVLHVSRYTGYDSSYLMAVPLLLATQVMILKTKHIIWTLLVLLIWGFLLFIPGMVWFVLLAVFWQLPELQDAWHEYRNWWQRAILLIVGLAWAPLLLYHLIGSFSAFKAWIGLPADFGTITDFALRIAMVPVNLFVVGPNDPELWLGRLPILDVITLGLTILGIWYYVRRWRANRTQLLAAYAGLAILIIGLGGAVQLSLIVPVVYLLAASGTAYLLNDWLKKFPKNPVARSFGIVLIAVVIAISSLYNLRSYFVAWPNNQQTVSRFPQIK